MVEKRDYLVYDRFIVPVKLHYYGYTDFDTEYRKQCGYQRTALQQYIDEYGWDNISTTIVAEGLTKKEAELLENQLIKEGWERGDCINKQGSGGEWRDNPVECKKQYRQDHKEEIKEYMKQYYKDHKEEAKQYRDYHKEEKKQYMKQYNQDHKEEKKQYMKPYNKQYRDSHKNELSQYNKQWRSTPAGKIYDRVHSYNKYHKDRIIITPMEARDMYELTGYIPDFIKSDDLFL